ncbi:MAG: O-antigen polysaccharide polymerase Wzy [Nocardioides sp.]
MVAGLIAIASMATGIVRQWARTSVFDPFAPYCFPLLYIAFSSLYPAWLILHDNDALMGFPLASYGTRTGGLVAVSVIGVAIGVHLSGGTTSHVCDTHRGESPAGTRSVARLLRLAGRALAALLVVVGVANAALSGPQARALNQTTYQVSDSVNAGAVILTLPAVLLILVARQHLSRTRASSIVDWALIGALITGSSLNGGRGIAIAAMLCMVFYFTRKKQSLGRTVAPFIAIAVFALAVLAYRQWAMRAEDSHSPLHAVATDLSPVSYTLGTVSGKVPSEVSYQFGRTYVDALIHMVPSFVSGPIMGLSDHSGSAVFRNQVLHMTDPNSGYGFSVPAEAYLNFGVVGVLLAALGIGWLVGWAYSSRTWPSLKTTSFMYVCLVAALPYTYRSDALGAVKGTLYPIVLLALSLLVARRIAASRQPAWLLRITGSRLDAFQDTTTETTRGLDPRQDEQSQRDLGR